MTDQYTSQSTPPVHGEVIPEKQAKQGNSGFQMLAVLLVSLALIVMVFGGLYLARSHHAADATPAAASQRTAGATSTGG